MPVAESPPVEKVMRDGGEIVGQGCAVNADFARSTDGPHDIAEVKIVLPDRPVEQKSHNNRKGRG